MGVYFINGKFDTPDASVKITKIESSNRSVVNGVNNSAMAELLANCEPMDGYHVREPIILSRIDLPGKYYVYTRGPYRSTDLFHEKELLAFWYYRCLELAYEKHCFEIEIPLISADTYSYDTAMQIAYDNVCYNIIIEIFGLDIFSD